MADQLTATNPFEEKVCEGCGSPILRNGLPPQAFACKRLCRRGCGDDNADADEGHRLTTRFSNKIDRRPGSGPNGDCWTWIGRKDAYGYGVVKVRGVAVKAHRVALFGHDGLDDPRFACHRCDNPSCVRPDHLFAGEAIDNVRDMHAKGRAVIAASGMPGARKLGDEQVREILRTQITGVAGSAKYGVSKFTILAIRRGELYKNVSL